MFCVLKAVCYLPPYICIISPTMELMDKLFERLVNNKKRHHGRFCMIYKVIKTLSQLCCSHQMIYFSIQSHNIFTCSLISQFFSPTSLLLLYQTCTKICCVAQKHTTKNCSTALLCLLHESL